MKIEAYGLSDVGKKRSRNEDSYLVNDDLQLYIVADGMGGHVAGKGARGRRPAAHVAGLPARRR